MVAFIDANQNMSYDDREEHTDWKFDDIGLLNLILLIYIRI